MILESGGIFLQKQLVCFFLRTGFFQYFCGNCSHNRIYFSCVYWTEGYTAHAGDALGFVRGFAVVRRNCTGRTFLCTQTAGSALRLEPCRFQNVSRGGYREFPGQRDCRKLPFEESACQMRRAPDSQHCLVFRQRTGE